MYASSGRIPAEIRYLKVVIFSGYERPEMKDFYKDISLLERTKKHMAFTVISGQHAGEKALLFEDGTLKVYEENSFFADKKDRIDELSGNGMEKMDGETVYYEQLTGKQRMVICGAGNVSIPLIRLAKMTGFLVTVIEDRPVFADQARTAGADCVLCDAFVHALEAIPGGRDAYFVVVTRGHRYDLDCLQSILCKEYAYIGMMASRRRTTMVKETLTGLGFEERICREIHMPVGLPIGAETPEEIAVSIIGEIIQERSRNGYSQGYPDDVLQMINEPDAKSVRESGQAILATIIQKKGSAPRKTGTKMLFLRDGSSVGTIGGGCAEAAVAMQAHRMLLSSGEEQKVAHVDMTAEEAEQEGMVCGGTYDVLLEKIMLHTDK